MQGLRNILSVLRPGGRAIILVPHGQEIFGTLDVALGHYRRYSHEELKGKMEQAGFAKVTWSTLSFGVAAIHVGERPITAVGAK